MDVRLASDGDTTACDTVAVGVLEGEPPAGDPGGEAARLADAGEARATPGAVAVGHAGELRVLAVGLGERGDLDGERARRAAARALERARELGARRLGWVVPAGAGDAVAAGLVEGTLLAAHRDARFKAGADDDAGPHELVIADAPRSTGASRGPLIARTTAIAAAQNAARDLQNAPPNHMTPSAIAAHAQALAERIPGLAVEIEDEAAIDAAGMGALAAVARGSREPPRVIVARYEPAAAGGPVIGLVGKGVTFDSGGLMIKSGPGMVPMKFDMSGAAVVLEAVAAIARLELPVRIVAVVGAVENMPGGGALRPGDVVTAASGTTIEVTNTDAEGRLVLADCLHRAREAGAERLVDVATLTGAAPAALGRTFAALLTNDQVWADAVRAASRASGELVWELPLHPDFRPLLDSRTADLVNSPDPRIALVSAAAEFLRRFTGDVPWVHLDIAGVASDVRLPYARRGGSGWGVRLLVELGRGLAGVATR